MEVQATVLDNGITVICDPMPQLDSVALGLWVGTGARCETAAQNGISHLLEHMAFKGTHNRSGREIADRIESVGGEINASTGTDYTTYFARMLREDTALGIDIIADIVCHPTLDPEELEREKHVILQEIGAGDDSPEDVAFEQFARAAWADQAIGRPVLGTRQTVRSFTAGDVRHYMAQHYCGTNMVLAIAGGFDPAHVIDMANACFASIDRGPVPLVPLAEYTGGDARTARQTMECQLVLGFDGVPFFHDDYFTAQLLTSILGGGMSSRLFQEVREKRGLCYAVQAFQWAFADAGLLGVYAATGIDDVDALLAVIEEQLSALGAGVTEEELHRARAQARAGLLMSLETPMARACHWALQQLRLGRLVDTRTLLQKIDAPDATDVARLAQSVFTRPAPTLSFLGERTDSQALDRFLETRKGPPLVPQRLHQPQEH